MKAKVTANGVRLYESNTTTSAAKGFAKHGEELDIEAEFGGWCKLADGRWVEACFMEAVEVSGGISSWNDLEDRPFGEETQRVESMPTVTVAMIDSSDLWLNMEDGSYVNDDTTWADYTQEFRNGFKVGKRYLVVWDGVEYECESHYVDGETGLGNGALSGWRNTTDNGLPFLFVHYYGLFGVAKEVGEHTFAIYELTETVTPLDEKYLPISDGLVVKSCTTDSTKKFKITVDDSGTITATEVTE